MSAPWSAHLRRDGVVLEGPDAVSYLQGQLSQDVAALAPGASAWSWLLAPTGKVDALVRVTRTGDAAALVDTDAGWGPALLARLTRFKLRTRVDLVAVGVPVTAWRGTGAAAAAADDGTPVRALWAAGEEAVDALGEPVPAGDAPAGEARAGGPADGGGWEAARIAAGVPAMGAELTERTIPAETGLVALTVSFTKGCYTGQELVARIDSRGGHAPRHLRGLRSAEPLAVGDDLVSGGKVVGTVTSAAVSASAGPVALGYVGRAAVDGDLRAVPAGSGPDAGGPAVTAVELPLEG